MQSIALARAKYYETDDLWWGPRPKEYAWLKRLGPTDRVAGLVYFTERALEEQIGKIPVDRVFSCTYESVCADPAGAMRALSSRLRAHGLKIDAPELPHAFACESGVRVAPATYEALMKSYDSFASVRHSVSALDQHGG